MTDDKSLDTDKQGALPTFFCEDLSAVGAHDELGLGAGEAAHLRAARLRPGGSLVVTDGAGHRWEATLIDLDRRSARCRLCHAIPTRRPYPIHLWAPVGNRDRSLWLVEKAVELRAVSIRWVAWERSKSVGDAGRSEAFGQRAQARARSALKQSGGGWLPAILAPTGLDVALDQEGGGTRWLADPAGRPLLTAAIEYANRSDGGEVPVVIAVGPEGGVTSTERRSCMDAGFELISLGPSILRFETAALAAIGLIAAAVEAGGT